MRPKIYFLLLVLFFFIGCNNYNPTQNPLFCDFDTDCKFQEDQCCGSAINQEFYLEKKISGS